MTTRFGLLVMAVTLLMTPVSLIAGTKSDANISWDDLVPPLFSADSPLAKLTEQQLSDLYFIAEIRGTLKRGENESEDSYLDVAEEITQELRAALLDVDQLIELVKSAKKSEKTLVRSLDDKVVRIPGYVLPLEFDGEKVKEFLLVPYVGACIHTPPPPENQVVYVKLKQGFKVDKLYEPVWATGTLSVKQSTRALSLVDGTSDIAVGYQLNAVGVERYQE